MPKYLNYFTHSKDQDPREMVLPYYCCCCGPPTTRAYVLPGLMVNLLLVQNWAKVKKICVRPSCVLEMRTTSSAKSRIYRDMVRY
jgi:hypothetical protein